MSGAIQYSSPFRNMSRESSDSMHELAESTFKQIVAFASLQRLIAGIAE
ncbi:hypothetical protein Poly41_27790 [Novipirellula artificiosorum]|uniref:Uncharacterized protein n=1 Tax=Novipirellula artificiosorum TaxID=2528016 RepID=A0A5C6DLN2_9BACT|nr:hypothetical protein Poly41_27790 [Novipirellula artificiosorum]